MTEATRALVQGLVDDLPKWLAWRIAERITSWDRTQLADEQFVRLSDLRAAIAACLAAEGKDGNPLQSELLDLIKLMPDAQVDEILSFVAALREARRLR